MSNSRAIAAVTAALRNLLLQGFNSDPDLPGVNVTTRPPDKARNGNTDNQVNLFLYHTSINATFANMSMPTRARGSENTPPPLPLNLHYLVTSYGENDDDVQGHLLLGRAMGVLHDNAALDRESIRIALNAEGLTVPTDLHEQIDRVHITPQPVSLDEMSKLWTTFQTQYRISAAYHASVVLIESQLPSSTAAPVTRRGGEDDYVQSQPDLTSPYPTLTDYILTDYTLPQNKKTVPPPHLRRTTFIPGDTITLRGIHLSGDVVLRFENTRLDDPIELNLGANANDREIVFTLPDPPTGWAAGPYKLTAIIGGTPERSASLWLPVAPVMGIIAPVDADSFPTLALVGDIVTVTVNVSPPVQRPQKIVLLVAGGDVRPDAFLAVNPDGTFGQLRFDVRVPARVQPYPLRLRVDGVDSLLIDYRQKLPEFRKDQLLRVT